MSAAGSAGILHAAAVSSSPSLLLAEERVKERLRTRKVVNFVDVYPGLLLDAQCDIEENMKEALWKRIANEHSRLTEQMAGDVSVLHWTTYAGQG